MLYNGFKVGVFYKNISWAKTWFADFLDKVDDACVSRFVKNGVCSFMIQLRDGTTISSYRVDDSSRGICVDKAFVEPCIDDDTINKIIRPFVKSPSIIKECG